MGMFDELMGLCNKCGEIVQGRNLRVIQYGNVTETIDWRFNICVDCLDSFRKSFMIKPEIVEDKYLQYLDNLVQGYEKSGEILP